MSGSREQKLEYLKALEEKARLQEGLPHLYGWKLYKWAHEFIESSNRYNFIVAANQISKGVLDGEYLPTPTGHKKAEDIKVGDELFDWRGHPTKVVAIPFVGVDECYEFEFDDGTKITTTKDHVWWAKGFDERFRKTYSKLGKTWSNPSYGEWKLFSTKEIFERGGYGPGASASKRFVVPVCEAVEYPSKDLPDPYLLGLLIGDGHFGPGITFTNPEPELQDYVLTLGAKKINASDIKKCPSFSLSFFRQSVMDLGLSGKRSWEKFIPKAYLTASIEQRKQLLYGLMDTDGCAMGHGVYYYSTTSEELAQDLRELVSSLGGKTRIAKRPARYKKDGIWHPARNSYAVYVLTDFCPFRLPRKAARWHPSRYKLERVLWSVRPVGKMSGRCFTVDASDGSFLVSRDYVVTHNSSTQIRKAIRWATEPELWPKLWKTKPNQFWYFYPTYDLATVEFDEKWVKEFLPRGVFKNHERYGWTSEKVAKKIHCIRFNTGITIYFKSYEQDPKSIQASSVHAVFCDEEVPIHLFSEINARISSAAVRGHFHSVFTATIGQSFWRETMEEKGELERFPKAFKRNVSMYDCLKYSDGSPTPWTREIIEEIKASCKSEAEIQRRVYGRFVVDEDLKYPGFSKKLNLVKDHHLPKDWLIYAGVDVGSGGNKGHPAAIVFIGVKPDFTEGRVFMGWRGDGIPTTAGDILQKFQEMKGKMKPVAQYYDWASKDFFTIASRVGEPFQMAEKNQEMGEQTLNVLFKNGMLKIFDTPELQKLVYELENNRRTRVNKDGDDLIDALRFAVTKVPWDFTKILDIKKKAEKKAENMNERERFYKGLDRPGVDNDGLDLMEAEFDEANEMYDYFQEGEAFD